LKSLITIILYGSIVQIYLHFRNLVVSILAILSPQRSQLELVVVLEHNAHVFETFCHFAFADFQCWLQFGFHLYFEHIFTQTQSSHHHRQRSVLLTKSFEQGCFNGIFAETNCFFHICFDCF
jgi:hypothetical protein